MQAIKKLIKSKVKGKYKGVVQIQEKRKGSHYPREEDDISHKFCQWSYCPREEDDMSLYEP